MEVSWRVKVLDCQPDWRVSTRDYHGTIAWLDRFIGCGRVIVHFKDGGQRSYLAKSMVSVWEVPG